MRICEETSAGRCRPLHRSAFVAAGKTPAASRALASDSRGRVPYIRPGRFCCAGPPGRSLKLSDSIVPEALLSDGQEFLRVSRSSALIQKKVAIEWPEPSIRVGEEVRKLLQFAPIDAVRFDNSFRV